MQLVERHVRARGYELANQPLVIGQCVRLPAPRVGRDRPSATPALQQLDRATHAHRNCRAAACTKGPLQPPPQSDDAGLPSKLVPSLLASAQ